jgi:hypothetical protein
VHIGDRRLLHDDMGHSRSYLEDLGIFRKCYDHLLRSGKASMLQKYSRNFVMLQEGLGIL